MMLSAILLSGSILVTHAPGWSYPMITTDMWSYYSGQDKPLMVTGSDTLHMFWNKYNQESRVGYKAFLPDGTVIHPETMVSNDAWSTYATGVLLPGDIAAGAWRQGTPAWYCMRDSAGGEVVPTSFMLPDPYWGRPDVEMAGDSLGRIHATFENGTNTVYAVIEPGVGEVWRDTIPDSHHETSSILVDGDRVHIIYQVQWDHPHYIQYDLQGNITVAPVSLIEGLTFISPVFSTALDRHGDLYVLYLLSHGSGSYLSLFKVDGVTGEVLITDREIRNLEYNVFYPVILGNPTEDYMHLMWREIADGYHVKYTRIDLEGSFIEEPYSAYDYSDEEVQQLAALEAAINDEGDIFAVWSQGDVEVGGYWIVMGWFDHNWVGIEEESLTPVVAEPFSLHPSVNPFRESTSISVEGSPVPGQLAVYDLSGRIVRTLFRSGENSFLWDGRSSAGEELPAGAYMIQGASAGRLASIPVVKL